MSISEISLIPEESDPKKITKVFLNNVDLYQNKAIAKNLLATETNTTFHIYGTIKDHEGVGVSEFKKVIHSILFKKSTDLIEKIFECEYIIYDIGPDPIEICEIEKVLNGLENFYENDNTKEENSFPVKYFILISSPGTWGTTQANDDGILNEAEYRRRRPHPNFVKEKCIERIVNNFEQKINGKVRTIVVCPGYTYGGINDIFHYIFKLAFFNKQKIPIAEPGNHVVPLIYIKDFAEMIKKLIEDFPDPKTRYIFAVQPHHWPIKAFTRMITTSLAGNIIKVKIFPKDCLIKYPEDIMQQRVIDAISTHLQFASSYFQDFPYTFTDVEEIGDKLAQEYRSERNLMPIKILIDGPPCVGKTTLAKYLMDYYQLNYIHPKTAIQSVINSLEKDIDDGNKFLWILEKEKVYSGSEIRIDPDVLQIEESTKELLEEWRNTLAELNAYLIEENNDNEYSFKYIKRCLRDILSSKLFNENQGYIIDSFPFTYKQAKEIFENSTSNEDEEEAEDLEDEPTGDSNNNSIGPMYYIILDATDDLLCQRGIQMSINEALKSGNTEEGMCKRLEDYRERNNYEDTSLYSYCYDNNIVPITIYIDAESKYDEIFEQIKLKIGSPHIYPLSVSEIAKLKKAKKERLLREEKENRKRYEETVKQIKADREAKLTKWSKEFEALRHEEELAAEAKTLPLRQYLAKFVLPTLTEGILEVSRIKPDDPIDYLAEFLFKHNSTGHVLPEQHTDEMKKLLMDDGKESVLTVLNELAEHEERKCTPLSESSSLSDMAWIKKK